MALNTDQSKWKYVVTAMDGSTPVGSGELVQANQKTYSDQLNGMKTASCAVPIDHPRLPWILNNDCLMKVYRRNAVSGNYDLKMIGDVVQTEESDDGTIGNVIITAADPFWRLNKRLIGMAVDATTGQATGDTYGTATAEEDLTVILGWLVQTANIDFNTGVFVSTDTSKVVATGVPGALGPVYASFVGPLMQQVAATLGGPDFYINPVEPSGSMPSTTFGELCIWPYRGGFQKNAIFEYGVGKHNVSTYNRLRSKQNACNNAYGLPQGWPNSIATGDQVAQFTDTASQNAISRFDDIASSDVANWILRMILAQEETQVRKQAQQQITFTPTVDCDVSYHDDYEVGDVVIARAFDASSKTYRYNGTIRIYGVNVTLDDSDAETVALTLIPDTVSSGATITGLQ